MRKGWDVMAAAPQAHALKEQIADNSGDLKESYLTSLRLIERLHRQLLDVIKSELDRTQQNDINSVQALLLFNIGEAELTAGELKTRGHYLGSNVSYNLKKLVEAGYIHHQRSEQDRRSVRVRLTEPGKRICRLIAALYERHLTSLPKVGGITAQDLDVQNASLQRLERFWTDQIRFRL
jgi:DNA-binding MarR family transcriptional regulator